MYVDETKTINVIILVSVLKKKRDSSSSSSDSDDEPTKTVLKPIAAKLPSGMRLNKFK